MALILVLSPNELWKPSKLLMCSISQWVSIFLPGTSFAQSQFKKQLFAFFGCLQKKCGDAKPKLSSSWGLEFLYFIFYMWLQWVLQALKWHWSLPCVCAFGCRFVVQSTHLFSVLCPSHTTLCRSLVLHPCTVDLLMPHLHTAGELEVYLQIPVFLGGCLKHAK